MSEKTDHDLLVGLNVTVDGLNDKVDDLKTNFTNHLRHHFLYTMALFTAFLSLVGAVALHFVLKGW